MSEPVKVTGIITSGICCVILAVVGEIEGSNILMNMAYSFGGVFGAFFGFPFAGKAVSKLVK